jgi:hypothetical protein
MFVMEYRKPLSELGQDSRKLWLEKDIAASPSFLVNDLLKIFNHHDITPFFSRSTGVSFKYSDSDTFLIRDVGQFNTLTKKLLDPHFKYGIRDSLNTLTPKLMNIDNFLKPDMISGFYDMLFDRSRYYKTVVVNLNPAATTIHDIDFLDIYYDSHYSLFPSANKPFSKKGPTYTNRIGVWFRIYLKPEACSFSVHKENINCMAQHPLDETVREDIKLTDLNKKKTSQYFVNSIEYHFKFHYDDFDSALILYLDSKRDELSKKLGYEVTVVDRHMLDLINMTLI